MRSVKRVLLRTLAVAAFIGLTIGGSVRLSLADSALDTGNGGAGYQNYHESIENPNGAGAGGSTDTGTSTETGTSYRSGSDLDNSAGYGTGGDTGSGVTSGSGSGGSTETNRDEERNDIHGSTIGGVTYPDNSATLGISGSGYWEK